MTAELLSRKQEGITTDIRSALEDIRMLDHPDDYQQEIRLLQAVEKVMEDAARILARPDTGPDAIAAETEAIELLYQARRNNPGSGSGGGSGGAPGGGGGSGGGALRAAALAALGPGSEMPSGRSTREVNQATGRTGKDLPEEFRSGLDAYFNALEEGSSLR